MDQILSFLTVIGTIDTIVLVAGLVWAVYQWATGAAPALLRLGNGLAKRKVAIFAKGNNTQSLESLLLDSGIFKKKNIRPVTTTGDVGSASDCSVYLVHWADWSNDIQQILAQKPNDCALVVYAPRDLGMIPEDQMKDLDGKRHTAVTNFRGRLLNDIVTAMITTSYAEK